MRLQFWVLSLGCNCRMFRNLEQKGFAWLIGGFVAVGRFES